MVVDEEEDDIIETLSSFSCAALDIFGSFFSLPNCLFFFFHPF